jgi:sugar lactone lactonase YvrE
MAIGEASLRGRWISASAAALVSAFAGGSVSAQETLFESRRITPPGEYTFHIEGPAVDASGNLYVVNFGRDGTIGKIAPGATQSQLFATLPGTPPGTTPPKISIGNGIRFDRQGRMYIADYNRQRVYVIESGESTPNVYFENAQFHQPNDIAIAADGTLYASDPKFKPPPVSGQIWRITRGADGKGHGEIISSPRAMGTTNGIDLSPDGTTLYVSESNTRQVWAYRLDGNQLLDARLVTQFAVSPVSEVDGLRTDVDGRIFLARPSAGKIAIITPDPTIPPDKRLLREVSTQGKTPTNLTFGGADGKTVFVTQMDGKFIEAFRTDRPGREPCLQVPGMC